MKNKKMRSSPETLECPAAGKAGELSKTEFRSACRAIFRNYIPAIENGRLRGYHREFIGRNESSSGVKRFRLHAELQRYDLSSITRDQSSVQSRARSAYGCKAAGNRAQSRRRTIGLSGTCFLQEK